MNIQVSARLGTRKRPKNYFGIISQNIIIGKTVDMSMEAIVVAFTTELGQFFFDTGLLDADGVNQATENAAKHLKRIAGTFREVTDENG